MIDVIHIFKKHAQIPKPYYTPELRKSFELWGKEIVSQIGHIQADILVLPRFRKPEINLNRIGTLILQDIIGYSGTEAKINFKKQAKEFNLPDWFLEQQLKRNPALYAFNIETRMMHAEIFAFEKVEASDKINVHLRYNAHSSHFSQPSRSNHKLYTLEMGKPIQLRINSKSDGTMSRGKERTYDEYEYTIEYLGKVNSVDFSDQSALSRQVKIPKNIAKVIDMRKLLY